MSQNQSGNARVKVGLIEFEAPPDKFAALLQDLLIRFGGLVNANNDLVQNRTQAVTPTAAAATVTTPTLAVPANLQTV